VPQVHENEVMRAYKTVNDSYIEPIAFTVPRRAEVFQSDIYPPATGLKPAVSAAEWLSGKDGIPSKIDLGSIYEGNAPVEVPADYKPPASAPAPAPVPVKAPAPPKEDIQPTTSQRGPPPTLSEHKGSIAAMASKFQDDDAEDDDDDDTSSFEDISRPAQKSIPAEAKAETKASPTKTSPPKAAPVSQPAPRPVQPQPASSKPITIPTSSAIPAVGSTPSPSGTSSVEASLEQIKSLLETQMKTINAQSEKIVHLAREVDTLKTKVGAGTQDQSERIRQLELELEAARS